VGTFAEALGVHDRFVPLARRYADAAFDLAWMDLQRSGFRSTVSQDERGAPDPFAVPVPDPELEARWIAFRDLPEGTLGRLAVEMYDGRGFALPGNPQAAAAYLSQHDFVHVLADYGTNLKGELEVFAFIGRADPDPKGFAWLATFVGLFETGYIEQAGFFQRDVQEHNISAPGMGVRVADAIRRGKEVCLRYGTDLFDVDYFALADWPVHDVRGLLNVVPKSPEAVAAGSAGVFDRGGMSDTQRTFADTHRS